ncbi:MAG: hypothetical protein R3275_05795 [Saprospiraceae bacterium]|nr:hypothetical protein [Saprospiraceae bacterium]
MSSLIVKNVFRIILLILVQVLIFKQVNLGGPDFNYFQIMIYPLAILLLPIDVPKPLVLLIAFAIGMIVDIFYDSPGLHAASLVFMAFLRPVVLRMLMPDTGYVKNSYPVASMFGLVWYLQYSGILLLAFFLAYFSLEAFTPIYFGSILLKTLLSFLVSFVTIILHQIIINPKS